MAAHARIAAPVATEFSQLETRRIRAAVADFDVPVSEYWCGVMARAREALGITQTHLAETVGTKQPTIHEIEKGKVGGSRFVPAICVALGIPSPSIMVRDDFDERWVEVGRFMRAHNLGRFIKYLELFEEEAGIAPPPEDQTKAVGSTHAAPATGPAKRLQPDKAR